MQYIVNFDIENSKIYDIVPENIEWKKLDKKELDGLRETWGKIRQCIAHKIGQSETRFIYEENLSEAMGILQQINERFDGDDLILVPLTHKYLSNYLIYEVQETPLDRVSVDGKIIQSLFAYTPQDDLKIMQSLIELWKQGNDVIFCAHNLDYEYRYIATNTPDFLKTLTETATVYKIIADKTSSIKSLEFVIGDKALTKAGKEKIENAHKFIIRDTWLMSGMRSIKDLGAAYGLPKLDYEYDFTRLTKDDLTEHDYEYNQRDNEVALSFLLDLMRQNGDYTDITKLPVSATQHYKNLCRKDPAINTEKIMVRKNKSGETKEKKVTLAYNHKRLAKNYNMPTAYLHTCFFNASGGGIVGVNPETTNTWFPGCHSFDISSAHPSQVFNRKFPDGKHTRKLSVDECKHVAEMMKACARAIQENPRDMYNYYSAGKDWLLHVKLVHPKEKKLKNGNIVNCLGTGNVTLDNSDFIVDGIKATRQAETRSIIKREQDKEHRYFKYGKVRECVSYCKWFYGIDLMYVLSFYDCEAVIIDEGYEYPLINVDQYTLNKFLKYASLKDEYKRFVKIGKNSGYAALHEEVRQSVEKGIAQEYTLETLGIHTDDYNEFMANELLRIKAIFNGLFGIEYQNPVHYEMGFTEEYDILPTGKVPDYNECIGNTSTHYCVGAYIAAWSRFELACMLHYAINEGATVLYWATDSIKCYGVSDRLFDNWYTVLKNYSTYGKLNKWDFGKVDCETAGHACDMYVIETLKYIAVTYNSSAAVLDNIGKRIDIKYTISGFRAGFYLKKIIDKWCVKVHGSEIISRGKEYTPENVEIIKKILAYKFKPHIIPPEQTGKLAPDYSFKGYPTPLGQINFSPLVYMPYNLGGAPII